MRAPLSALEVERPLVLGKGWLELGLDFEYKRTGGRQLFGILPEGGAWSAEGAPVAWRDARWVYTTERADLRYGISRRADLWVSVPFHYVHLGNEVKGTDIADFGLGEPRFGWTLEWYHHDASTTSVVTDLAYKAPAGNEAPGNYIGGPNTVTRFPMSTGTPDISLDLRAKQQIGPVALTGSVGFVYRFSGVSQFVVEVTEYQFSGRFQPGHELHGEFSPLVQLGPIAVVGDAIVRRRFVASVGTTSGGLNWNENLDPIPGSDGWSLDAGGGLIANVTRGFDVHAGVSVPVRGEDLNFFPLEDLTPTRGVTYSTTVELRY